MEKDDVDNDDEYEYEIKNFLPRMPSIKRLKSGIHEMKMTMKMRVPPAIPQLTNRPSRSVSKVLPS